MAEILVYASDAVSPRRSIERQYQIPIPQTILLPFPGFKFFSFCSGQSAAKQYRAAGDARKY
jgi:hypothetical protein